MNMKVILASGSPRRKELLKLVLPEYEIKVSDIEEILEEGRLEGRQFGDAERLCQSVEQVMKNLSVDLTEACRILGVTLEDYEKAKALQ